MAQEEDVPDCSRYLQLPTTDEVIRCHRAFYQATSNAAVAMAICAVCAREKLHQGDTLDILNIAEVPNVHLLRPKTHMEAHDLYHDMLLEPSGIVHNHGGLGEIGVKLCDECHSDLVNGTDKPPRHSLANNLWIGRVPWDLQVLTLPEQLLIALVYPRVFVYKLFPAHLHRRVDESTYQRGMRGNVSSYALDSEAIADMLVGNMMPRPPEILASVISLTFIGRGNLPRSRLRSLFKVRRKHVLRAILWLKAHNKYYCNIKVDHTVLAQLPDDDVPEQIISIVRQTQDVGVVESERAGIIDNDDDDAGDEAGVSFDLRRSISTQFH